MFLAKHVLTGREVAIKFLTTRSSRNPSIVERFLSEARIAASLDHPHVVDILDMRESEESGAYLVMERLRGRSLAEELARRKTLSEAQTLRYLSPVLHALGKAHLAGVVHRDFKPDNIFLSRDGLGREVPKLLDFGVAREVEPTSTRLTVRGQLLGTPPYMAPEQTQGEDATPACDLWAVGVVILECVSGEVPFRGPTLNELFQSIHCDEPQGLEQLCAEWQPIVAKLLEKDPADRYPDVESLLNDLLNTTAAKGLRGAERDTEALLDPSSLRPEDPEAPTLLSTQGRPQSGARVGYDEPVPARPRSSLLSRPGEGLRSPKMLAALGAFVLSLVIYLAVEGALAPKPSPHFIVVDVATDYADDEYGSMVFLAKARDGAIVDRVERDERMPYHFQVADTDPRETILHFKLLDHTGKELPAKVEREIMILPGSQAGPQVPDNSHAMVMKVFFRKPEPS